MHRNPLERSNSYDPIQNSWSEAPSFNEASLKGGAALTWLQRFGFAVLGLMFWGVGCVLLANGIGEIRQHVLANGSHFSIDVLMDVLFVAFGLGFVVLGVLMLKNVLTFSRKS
jgi:hypothetical protein